MDIVKYRDIAFAGTNKAYAYGTVVHCSDKGVVVVDKDTYRVKLVKFDSYEIIHVI